MSNTTPSLATRVSAVCPTAQICERSVTSSVDISYYCWTDSMIALCWIQSDPNEWKAFVANWVSEIQNLTHPDNWFHCPGTENPADLLTRGMCAEELVRSTLWLHGPEFVLNETFSEADSLNCNVHAAAGEEETADVTLVCSVEKTEPVFNVDRWGTLTKAIRVVAWVFSFQCVDSSDQEGYR